MELITLIVIALLCLLSAKTTIFAYVLFAFLLLVLPFIFTVVTVIAIAFHFINQFNKGNFMNRQHYLETIETVLAWDLPDEALANAIYQQFAYITNRTGDSDNEDKQELASI